MTEQPNVVLIHGAFADGSSWSTVVEKLQGKGYRVTAPQFPLTSLADDVARLRQALAWQDGPTIVVGHSYGGQVMTALGDDVANVVGLVYIAAFGLDAGESINAVGADAPSPPALANLVVDEHGFGRLPDDDFVGHFAADVDPTKARVMHAAQQPVAMSVFGDVMRTPAWRSLPSWYLVAADDEAIAPDAERMFAKRMGAETVEIASSHVAMASHPDAVVGLIEAAARATASPSAAAGSPA
jgi:pimeloyl-ACP methyl ester carboxylesterase